MTEQERLLQVLQNEQMNAKQFANEIQVSQATMSNILGGRNKPSLEVMQKVLQRFRSVSPEWLILGVGTMYKRNPEAQEQSLFDIRPNDPVSEPASKLADQPQVADTTTTQPQKMSKTASKVPAVQVIERTVTRKVTKVVVFFEDGTFQEL